MITSKFSHNLFPAVAALTIIGVSTPSAFAQRNRTMTLDAGTVIPVKLEDKLSSKTNDKGDTFTAKIKVDGDNNDYVGLPDGTIIEGRILSARQKEGKNAGTLELGFQRLRMPSGQSFPISGSLIGLDNKSVNRDSDGRLVAKPGSENKRITYAGYGAGAGVLVGLLSGGKLNLNNLLLGGLLGYAAGSTQKASDNVRDVELKTGTEMGVRLDKKLTIRYTSELDDPDDLRYRRRDDGTGNSRLDRRRDDPTRTRDTEDRDLDRQNPRTSGEIGVLIGDRDVRFDSTAQPVMIEDKVWVPLLPVLKSARIKYTTSNNAMTVMAPNSTVKINVGSRIVMDGNRRVRTDMAPRRMNGAIYVPVKVVEIATGYKASWDSATQTLTLDE
jgi:hypothetical protein